MFGLICSVYLYTYDNLAKDDGVNGAILLCHVELSNTQRLRKVTASTKNNIAVQVTTLHM